MMDNKVNKDLTREFLSATEAEVLASNVRYVKNRVNNPVAGLATIILALPVIAAFAIIFTAVVSVIF